MKKLIEGIVAFRKSQTEASRALFAKLALGQKPDALFIACSDSRVVPNVFASADPGDLFVLRNVGNLVPPVTEQDESVSAALEFAIFSLNVTDIVVCGHSECGAMQALIKGTETLTAPNLKAWLNYGKASMTSDIKEHNQLSKANVLKQLDHLRSYPFIRERVEQGTLRLHGWWFDIGHADVYCYEPAQNQFVLIDEDEAQQLLARMK